MSKRKIRILALLYCFLLATSCTDVLNPQTVLTTYRKSGLTCNQHSESARLELRILPEEVVIANELDGTNTKWNKDSLTSAWQSKLSNTNKVYLQVICKGATCATTNPNDFLIKLDTILLQNTGVLPVQLIESQGYYEYMILYHFIEPLSQKNNVLEVINNDLSCSFTLPNQLVDIIEEIRYEIN
jgi:hypothetical protein